METWHLVHHAMLTPSDAGQMQLTCGPGCRSWPQSMHVVKAMHVNHCWPTPYILNHTVPVQPGDLASGHADTWR